MKKEQAGDPDLVVPAAERKRYEEAFSRFASVFPDRFYITERGRFWPDETQDKGRLLSAGYHSVVGFYRDDTPLMELILDDKGRKEIDRLWDEFDYIAVQNAYYNSNNQKGANISFTPGAKAGAEGSIELKTAWKILTATDDATSYITRIMRIYVPAQHSSTGKAFCTPTLKMGLIGMHIIHKGANQPDWIWSTFEHIRNAPLSSTPLSATATAPSGPCNAPRNAPLMSLYNPACKTCPINAPPVQPDDPFYFATSQPYAKQYLNNGYGTQVVRCSSVV